MTYDVTRNFKPMKKLRGHDTTIWQMDFSLDSNTLVTDALLFFDVRSGKRNSRGASETKDEPWQTWTCRRGWLVNGIFPPCAQVNDVNGVDRSPDSKVVATGDDFGFVKLFKYPCPEPKSPYIKHTGHSSHVTNVMFTRNASGQRYLVTTGGNDKCIFQWKFIQEDDDEEYDEEVEDLSGYAAAEAPAEEAVEKKVDPELDDMGFEMEEAGAGDQALAVKPFEGQIKHCTPDAWKKPNKSAGDEPENNLELKWAHGFRSFDTRGNLKYTSENKVLFTTAGVGVVQDTNTV
jgi:microtubule-associated protein-like 6